jgi:uncharacterized protein with NRDE domain
MCVAAIAFHAHPRWPLIAIGNRDEFHARPAAPLARWEDGGEIIAGRDLQSGGTWLGVTNRRFVLITNRRGFGEPDPAKASRGELVTVLLAGGDPADLDLNAFNAFNVVVADQRQARFLTNRPDPLRTALPHGIYGLSNGALDEPWPKTLYLKSAVTDWLADGNSDTAPLFAALACEDPGSIGLPPRDLSDIAVEPAETPPFIRSQHYGTRCSTVVTIDAKGRGRMGERRFDARGALTGETVLDFDWAAR